MFNKFYPGIWMESTYSIPFEEYFNKGYRAIIFDIDNTLVCHGAPQSERSLKLLNELKAMGFSILFLSNNKEPRVKMFNDPVDCKYIYKAKKPLPGNYLEACKVMNTSPSNTMFVGDQLFTDIWGANLAGIFSILVKPIDKHEEIQIVLKRKLEKIVLFFYKKHLEKGSNRK